MGMAGEGERLEKGVVGLRSVGKVGLLRGPVEETGGKVMVVEEVGVDDGSDEGSGKGRSRESAAEDLLNGGAPRVGGLGGGEESAAEAPGDLSHGRRMRRGRARSPAEKSLRGIS